MDFHFLSKFPRELTPTMSNIINEYEGIRTAYYSSNYEQSISKFGKFAELIFQLLSQIGFGVIPEAPNFTDITARLERLPGDSLPVSVRILIPRLTSTLYAIRSKRGAVHLASGVSPNYIDATIVLTASNWIIAELVRLYINLPEKDIINLLNRISYIPIPLLEVINGDIVILKPEMQADEQVLMILLHSYPNFVDRKSLKMGIKSKSESQINRGIASLKKNAYIHETTEGIKLTSSGINRAVSSSQRYI